MLHHSNDIQSVRRIFDWPLAIQTLLFIGSIFGIAIYSENRITRMEQSLLYHDKRMERMERIDEKLTDAVSAIQSTQDKIVAVISNRAKRSAGHP